MHKNISATTLRCYLSRSESCLFLTSHGLWGVEGGHSVSCQGDQQSCNAHVDPALPPPLETGTVPTRPTAHCTGAQAPLDTHSALEMQKLPANISRHYTMYFTLFLLFSELTAVWINCAHRFNTMCLWLSMPFILFQTILPSIYFKRLMVILLHMFEHRPKILPKPH